MLIEKLIVKEFLFPFGISLFSVLSILLLGRIVPLLEFFVRAGAGAGDLLKTVILFMPLFLQFALPMAGLFGLLICFVKLTQSNEVIGLFAIGIRPGAILRPVLLLSIFLFLSTLTISTTLVPHSKLVARQFLKDLGENKLYTGIPEGRFVELTKGLILFANKNRRQGKRLKGVFIWDYREKTNPYIVYAQKGTILGDESAHSILLKLENGVIYRETKDLYTIDILTFKEYSLTVGFEATIHKKSRGEMKIGELMDNLRKKEISPQKRKKYVSELIRRFMLPVGAFLLSLLAAPLGIFFGRSGMSMGVALGIMSFLGYYLLTTLCTNLYETSAVGTAFILSLPNLILTALSIFLWRKLFKKGPVLIS